MNLAGKSIMDHHKTPFSGPIFLTPCQFISGLGICSAAQPESKNRLIQAIIFIYVVFRNMAFIAIYLNLSLLSFKVKT
jgi:hypothetical protein